MDQITGRAMVNAESPRDSSAAAWTGRVLFVFFASQGRENRNTSVLEPAEFTNTPRFNLKLFDQI